MTVVEYLDKGNDLKKHTVFPYIGLHHFEAVKDKDDKSCFKLIGYLYSNPIEIMLVGKPNYKNLRDLQRMADGLNYLGDLYE